MKADILAQPVRPPWQDRWASGLFWSWNFIFMAFMLLGFGPRLIPELIAAVRADAIGWQFLAYALALSIIPAAAMALGWFFLRGYPQRLFAIGYVVEGPLMLILAVRFFAVRQASTGLAFLLAAAIFGMATFLWRTIDRNAEERPIAITGLQLPGLSLMVLVSLYAAVWIGFYVLPGAYYVFEMARSFIRFPGQVFQEDLVWLPFALLGFILLLFTSTLLMAAPIVVPYLSMAAWWSASKQLIRRRFGPAVILGSTVVAGVVAILFVAANRQPQVRAFAMLQEQPESPGAAREILAQSETIRAGLLNAYLGPFRYISSVGEVNHISEMYHDVFSIPNEAAKQVQGAYEVVARPLLYQPYVQTGEARLPPNQPRFAMERESAQAARLYQRVFDQPIVEGEREVILSAARSTWSNDQAEAALQTLDERKVHLERQGITVKENGDWAEIELYEVYRNTTADRQEVIYYFSLPESAVITGIWLGESPDRAHRHAYVVAPRGAAQAVYRNEVRRNMDPALVEQIGPRQYRLRVFPIPPQETKFNPDTDRTEFGAAPAVHFWMTWKTLALHQRWPLPHLSLRRNIYWDKETIRLVNNLPFRVIEDSDWMHTFVEPSAPPLPEHHEIHVLDGYTVSVTPAGQSEPSPLPENLRLAVVVDRSRSMQDLDAELNQALTQLANLTSVQIDLYLTASPYRGEAPVVVPISELKSHPLEFLGGQNPAQMLAQFAELQAGREYDAVIVLTDGSGYELGPSPYNLPAITMPVWMVHLGDRIPIGYDDKTLEAIQSSGGGVVGGLEEVLNRMAASLPANASSQSAMRRDLIDGYVWAITPDAHRPSGDSGEVTPSTDNPADSHNPDGFSSIAARYIILSEMQRLRGQLDSPQTIDQLHRIATDESIVTPYSSMIVLVNQQQELLLQRLSENDDRYQREVEDLGDTTPASQAPLTGVPEPEEWLLLIGAALILTYALVTRGYLRKPFIQIAAQERIALQFPTNPEETERSGHHGPKLRS